MRRADADDERFDGVLRFSGADPDDEDEAQQEWTEVRKPRAKKQRSATSALRGLSLGQDSAASERYAYAQLFYQYGWTWTSEVEIKRRLGWGKVPDALRTSNHGGGAVVEAIEVKRLLVDDGQLQPSKVWKLQRKLLRDAQDALAKVHQRVVDIFGVQRLQIVFVLPQAMASDTLRSWVEREVDSHLRELVDVERHQPLATALGVAIVAHVLAAPDGMFRDMREQQQQDRACFLY